MCYIYMILLVILYIFDFIVILICLSLIYSRRVIIVTICLESSDV